MNSFGCHTLGKHMRDFGENSTMSINDLRRARVRCDQDRYMILHSSHHRHKVVLVRGCAVAEPDVVGELDEKVCAVVNRFPCEWCEEIFPADERADGEVGCHPKELSLLTRSHLCDTRRQPFRPGDDLWVGQILGEGDEYSFSVGWS